MWKRIFLRPGKRQTDSGDPKLPLSAEAREGRREHSAGLPFIQIEEVTDAAPFAGRLFEQKFHHPIPDYPRHFVVFHESGGALRNAVAYVHYLPFENTYLCGGLCVDTRAYRKMKPEQLKVIRHAGSLAEYTLRETFPMVGPCAAIFGSVGDATSRVVCLRSGFVDTGEPHLMAVWRDAIDDEKPELVRKVIALGPF